MSGDIIDVKFNLHDETVNSVHVNNLITAILKSIDNELSLMGEVGDMVWKLVHFWPIWKSCLGFTIFFVLLDELFHVI